MIINKNLVKAAGYNPTKESRQKSIFEMCDLIEEGEISLPLYQRDLSWTLKKSIELLNYQLLGKSPVSPISINVINNIDEAVPQVTFIDREIVTNIVRGQNSVVDGQQRLTTNYKAYINHDDFKTIVLDLGKGQFVKFDEQPRPNQIPVGILLNKDDSVLFEYAKEHRSLNDPQAINILLQVKNKMKSYNYTINQAIDLTEDEQIDWFEVLNNADSRVSIIQMRFSKLKAHGIDIYTQYTNIYKEKMYERGYDDFFTPQKTNVSYPIAALNPAYETIVGKEHNKNFAPMPSDTKENQLCNLCTENPEKLTKCFEITLGALDRALDFISEHNLKKPERVDYINYLLGYLVFHPQDIGDATTHKLIEWYNTVDFRNKSNSSRRKIFTELLNI